MSFSFCLYYIYLCFFSQSDYVMLRHFLQYLSYNRNTADIVYRLTLQTYVHDTEKMVGRSVDLFEKTTQAKTS